MPLTQEFTRALTGFLQDGDAADRCYSIRALASLGVCESAPHLIARLRDEDIDVCVDAANALGRMGIVEAVPDLLESLLNDPDGEVKTAVIGALAAIGHDSAVEPLREIARKRPQELNEGPDEGWDIWWDMQLAAIKALGKLGAESSVATISALLDNEEDEAQDLEHEAFKALAGMGGAGEQAVLQWLECGVPRQRRRALQALATCKSSSTTKAIGRALLDRAPEVRAAAAVALGARGAGQYVEAILLLLKDAHAEVRKAAMLALDTLAQGATQSLPLAELLSYLSDPDSALREQVLGMLLPVADTLEESNLELIRAALDGAHPAVSVKAAQLLGAARDSDSAGALIGILCSATANAQVRQAAAHALGNTGSWNASVCDALCAGAASKDQSMRAAALDAMLSLAVTGNQMEDKETRFGSATDALIAAARGDLLGARRCIPIVAVSKQMPPPVSTADLAVQAGSSTLASIALGSTQPEAMEPEAALEESVDERLDDYRNIVQANNDTADWLFAQAANDPVVDLRCNALRRFGRGDLSRIEDLLRAALDSLQDKNPVVRREAAAALARLDTRYLDESLRADALEFLLAALGDVDRDLRIQSVRAISAFGGEACVPALIAALADKDTAVRISALSALASVTAVNQLTEISGLMCESLGDLQSGVRKSAAQALAALIEKFQSSESIVGNVRNRLIETGFKNGGLESQELARALKSIDPSGSIRQLLDLLQELNNSAERRIAIEMLEVLTSIPKSIDGYDPKFKRAS